MGGAAVKWADAAVVVKFDGYAVEYEQDQE